MRSYHAGKCHSINGMTLLEVMLASALAVMLVTWLTNFYIKFNHSLLSNQQTIEQSFTASKLISLFRSEIEMAGQVGCSSLKDHVVVQPYQQYSLTNENQLQVSGHEIQVRYQALPTMSLLSPGKHSQTLIMNADIPVNRNEILVISNCEQAEIFKVKSVNRIHNTLHITPWQPLHFAYKENAEIGRLVSHHYFLQQHGDKTNLMLEENGMNTLLAADVTDLTFIKDASGIAYQFQFNHNLWTGYAVYS